MTHTWPKIVAEATPKKLALFSVAKLEEKYKLLTSVVPWTIQHLLYVGGFAAMAYGIWMVSRPAGVFVAGWFAVKIAVLAAQKESK